MGQKLTTEEKARRRAKRIENNLKKYGVEWPSQLKSTKEKRLKSMVASGYKKREQTCLDKYGSKSHFNSEAVKNKIKHSNIERYGVSNVFESEEIYKKTEDTRLALYGSRSMTETELFKEKRSETLIDKYGTDNISSVESVKEAKKYTWLTNYGVNHPWKSELIRNKGKQTNLSELGVEYPIQSPAIKEKMQLTCLERYGATNYLKTQDIVNKRAAINEEKRIAAYENLQRFKNTKPLFSVDDFKGTGPTVYEWLKVDKNEKFFAAYWGFEPCGKFYHTNIEQFIINLLDTLNIKYFTKDRSAIAPFELDFYIPSLNLAIETHGMYYHSTSKNTNNSYHFNKFDLCKQKNIRLIQIFEDDILYKPHIILNRLYYILNKTRYKIYGRSCTLSIIDSAVKDRFLNKYHLQGTCSSKVNLGAFYKKRLVAVMTLSQNRISICQPLDTWELTRFATIGRFNVVGIASKLFKHFLHTYNTRKLPVITYSDLCWGEGNLYKQLGFNFILYTAPGYFYYHQKTKQRYHRFSFRKSELPNKLPIFDPLKTEFENMADNGYLRIYNAGNAKYIYTI